MTATTDPDDPRLTHGVDNEPVEQAQVYLVLPPDDEPVTFVRPVRYAYFHTTCGQSTRMSQSIAETYARSPGFYGSTYCTHCQMHKPVGAGGEFYWIDGDGQLTDEKVGT